jgi:hypothetical protein
MENFNLELMKRVSLWEKFRLQMRAEVFNLFAHPKFQDAGHQHQPFELWGAYTNGRSARFQFGLNLLF